MTESEAGSGEPPQEMVDETGVMAAGESSETGVTVRRVMSWSDRIRPTSSIGDAMR